MSRLRRAAGIAALLPAAFLALVLAFTFLAGPIWIVACPVPAGLHGAGRGDPIGSIGWCLDHSPLGYVTGVGRK